MANSDPVAFGQHIAAITGRGKRMATPAPSNKKPDPDPSPSTVGAKTAAEACGPKIRRPVSRAMKPGATPTKLTPGHTFQGSTTKAAMDAEWGASDTARLVGLLAALGLGTAGISGMIGAVDAKPGQRGRGFARGAAGGLGSLGGATVGLLPTIGAGVLAERVTGSPLAGRVGAVGTGMASAMGGRYLGTRAFDAMFPEQPEQPEPQVPLQPKTAAEWGASVAAGITQGRRTRSRETATAQGADIKRRLAEATS